MPPKSQTPLTDGAFQDRVFEMRVTGEEAVISKDVRIYEEVVLRRVSSDHIEIVRDTLRETKADIEDSTAPR